jgi:hypothetical protein
LYIYFKIYNIFLFYFVLKILVVLYYLPNNKFKYYSLITLIISSICWEIEQYTYRKNIYKKKEYKDYYLFHSIWHVLSALSYYLAYKGIILKKN